MTVEVFKSESNNVSAFANAAPAAKSVVMVMIFFIIFCFVEIGEIGVADVSTKVRLDF